MNEPANCKSSCTAAAPRMAHLSKKRDGQCLVDWWTGSDATVNTMYVEWFL